MVKRLNLLKLSAYIVLLSGKKIKFAKINPIYLKLNTYIILVSVKKIKFTKIKRLHYFTWCQKD